MFVLATLVVIVLVMRIGLIVDVAVENDDGILVVTIDGEDSPA